MPFCAHHKTYIDTLFTTTEVTMLTLLHTWDTACRSAKETFAGCSWVFHELVSPYAKRQVSRALLFLFLSTLGLMAIPYIMKYVIDAYSAGDLAVARTMLYGAIGIGLLQTIANSLHDHFRERAWNRNFYTIHTTLVRKMYSRTLDEIVAENSEVGAEQIESLKDKVQNILYLFLFESSIVLTTIVAATGFLYLVDVTAGICVTLLTVFNLLWFFILNTSLDEKMEPVDQAFRRATRRIVEKLNLVASVKAAGVEDKMVAEIGSELAPPLQADFKVWGIWFLSIDSVRRIVNAFAPILLLLYGVSAQTWTPGTLAAVSSWSFMIAREYGFIGHLMRHLASQVARIKATREALSRKPDFEYATGIVYERKSACK